MKIQNKIISPGQTVGTSIYFREKANKVVAESKANRLEPEIRKIGLRKRSNTTYLFALNT